jgi:hypothetical protein
MKAPRVRLRTLLLVIALSAVILAGVAGWLKRPVRPHSSVFTGLDPVALLGSKPGYQVKSVTTWNVFNASHGHAYREWHGIVTAPDVPSARQMQSSCGMSLTTADSMSSSPERRGRLTRRPCDAG